MTLIWECPWSLRINDLAQTILSPNIFKFKFHPPYYRRCPSVFYHPCSFLRPEWPKLWSFFSLCTLEMASCFESQNFAWRLTRITIGLSHIWARCKTRLNILGTFLIWFGSRRGFSLPLPRFCSIYYLMVETLLRRKLFHLKIRYCISPFPWKGIAYLRQPLWGR